MQDEAMPHLIDEVKNRISQMNENDRVTMDKLRKVARDLTNQGLNLSNAFLRFV